MRLGSRVPEGVTIYRKAERGADLVTQLLLFEFRKIRASVAYLYTSVPNPVRRFYRRTEANAAKEKAKATRERTERLEAVLRSASSTDEEKRLARIELVAAEMTGEERGI